MGINFLEYVNDKSIFKFGGINLYKAIYVAFINKEISSDLKPVQKQQKSFNGSAILHSIRGLLKFFSHAIKVRRDHSHPIFFYCHNNRLINYNGDTYDIYNYRIVTSASRKNFLIFQDYQDEKSKLYAPDFIREDFLALFAVTSLFIYAVSFITFFHRVGKIKKKFPLLGFSRSELLSIVVKFFAQYYVYRLVLRLLKPKKALVLVHYTRESFLAACKKENVLVVELMHGRITKTNLFYNLLSPVVDEEVRYLCPDKLMVYGDYWKKQLVEMNFLKENDIEVIGYYLFEPALLSKGKESSLLTTILITTQHTVQDELLQYINFLSQNLDSNHYQIIIKPHPSENSAKYYELEKPGFIQVDQDSVYNLLSKANIHISVYSTVLFEALRYNVSNFSLYAEKVKEQWNDIIQSGVAKPLLPNEEPYIYPLSDLDTSRYFAEFDPGKVYHL